MTTKQRFEIADFKGFLRIMKEIRVISIVGFCNNGKFYLKEGTCEAAERAIERALKVVKGE